MIQRIDTVVVGGGQAGIAMSEHLTDLAVPHIVLERGRIAEKWLTGRWDSLVANGPAWHDRFPNLEFEGIAPDTFATKQHVAEYFNRYAQKINAPIHTSVEVKNVKRNTGHRGFIVETSEGTIEAMHIVAATGPFQQPVIPSIAPQYQSIQQIHSADYFNPQQLPKGAVMVIGAGSSGVQIADELNRAGRTVHLSVGPHNRPPRSYRGLDFCWWLGVLGEWDQEVRKSGSEHVTIAVSGAHGGRTIDFRALAHQGITLYGRTKAFNDTLVSFHNNLADNIIKGDENYFELLDAADAYMERNGLELPEEPDARKILSDPDCIANPIFELDLIKAGISSIIWATGYATNYDWLKVNAFDEHGTPQHQRGVSSEPGVYFIGLPWLSCRGSSFIWGVWHDAKRIAGHIDKQRVYFAYKDK